MWDSRPRLSLAWTAEGGCPTSENLLNQSDIRAARADVGLPKFFARRHNHRKRVLAGFLRAYRTTLGLDHVWLAEGAVLGCARLARWVRCRSGHSSGGRDE
jgi:hypothetical protein